MTSTTVDDDGDLHRPSPSRFERLNTSQPPSPNSILEQVGQVLAQSPAELEQGHGLDRGTRHPVRGREAAAGVVERSSVLRAPERADVHLVDDLVSRHSRHIAHQSKPSVVCDAIADQLRHVPAYGPARDRSPPYVPGGEPIFLAGSTPGTSGRPRAAEPSPCEDQLRHSTAQPSNVSVTTTASASGAQDAEHHPII